MTFRLLPLQQRGEGQRADAGRGGPLLLQRAADLGARKPPPPRPPQVTPPGPTHITRTRRSTLGQARAPTSTHSNTHGHRGFLTRQKWSRPEPRALQEARLPARERFSLEEAVRVPQPAPCPGQVGSMI
ncbi:hypothetical protein GHT09_001585 [Marmota monax]|uniref:Uncharacterized protein n=1 Tax=Marmota monax TaxID=9995 RepID=A0A834PXR4_MARMO|nr:hypothetical protein GHT09_001585 [Marmota monax]